MAAKTPLDAGGACSIARSLNILGERWALLIVREAFKGRARFSEFQAELHVAPDVLTDRLSCLVEGGVLERRPYREEGRRERHAYYLTAAGRELLPVLAAFMTWGDAHLAGDAGPPAILRRRSDGAPIHVSLSADDGSPVTLNEIEMIAGPGATPTSLDRDRPNGAAHED